MKHAVLTWAVCLLLVVSAQAQSPDAVAKHQAVIATYPNLMQALRSGDYRKARALCQQVIGYEPRDPMHRYNLACIESLAGNVTAGLAALQQANALGYADVNGLRTDPDLALLRADKRFDSVLQGTTRNALRAPVRKASTPLTQVPKAQSPTPQPAKKQ
ncbi:hypothetical protein F0P96_02860 [Hymenobacter busanensis]|uniref:Uncharacterized protein n=1 Tax=Hymenobacter busanensis TaxID=2607656 RepID=A0A7L4ZV29_9BACT|nr:hypothetical protein [Hymenobacter busanensis]KAA9339570.1 hypothetical protein F0P96_02860 [Hymenobacter busanensis]QHJ06675.1 hypothetical protein GUY19_04895 [Hymenobacter busanensis]